ncbi:MAG: 30S ribosomal protein S4 [archaeon]
MGDPKKIGKKFFTPKKPWDKIRIEAEKKLTETYGLKNKKEIWLSETFLRKKRQNARKLLALSMEEKAKKEKELLESLRRTGLAKKTATLDDVLSLKTEELLERRLQTIVWRKGLANTVKQARQFITHGHIAISGKKVSVPSYIVKVDEEKDIGFYGKEIPLKPLELKEKKTIKKEENTAFRKSSGAKVEASEKSSDAKEEKEDEEEEKKEKTEETGETGKIKK